jgi:hypothetical protein
MTSREETALALLLAAIGPEPLPKAGNAAHAHLAYRLGRAGWTVWGEVQAPLDREARIDLVARRDGLSIALEIDRGRPKRSTLEKLAAMRADLRVACYLLDEPLRHPPPPGVRVLLLPSRPPTEAERAFRGYGRRTFQMADGRRTPDLGRLLRLDRIRPSSVPFPPSNLFQRTGGAEETAMPPPLRRDVP